MYHIPSSWNSRKLLSKIPSLRCEIILKSVILIITNVKFVRPVDGEINCLESADDWNVLGELV